MKRTIKPQSQKKDTKCTQLELKYDPFTIKHLGVSLYSRLPSVLSELISNAYDADADNVSIRLLENQDNKEIIITDDGEGMSFPELNEKYLLIGRNRRLREKQERTNKNRPIIGKKGLGKLSVFGICKEVDIKTVKDNKLNHFTMNLDEILESKGTYHPKIISNDKHVNDSSSTTIHLKQIKRKTPFNINETVTSLAKKFTIFDEMKTIVQLNNNTPVHLTNEMKFDELDIQFKWEFPSEDFSFNYKKYNKISGVVITPKTPLRDTSLKGIYLTSRGKIVNDSEFYGVRANDHFHSYIAGYLSVDFIDELKDDIISTDRHSLNWETDEAAELKKYLQNVIKQIGVQWRNLRAESAAKETKVNGVSTVHEWKSSLPSYERPLADKIVDPILNNSNLDQEETTNIVQNIVSQFGNPNFKEYASQLANTVNENQLSDIIKLMKEWKITELRELSALASARIEVIKKFEELLNGNTREVPTLHNFLKEFSWLLDPRILEFDDEVQYSKLLKTSYPNEKLEESNRRIDFLCSNALGKILYVIEIKKSTYKVDYKAIEQAFEYKVFLESRFASETGFSNVVCYVIGGSKSTDPLFVSKERSYLRTGEVFVKTYSELLEQSKRFHREFIDAHNSFNESNTTEAV
jgi:hypothetical protein